MALHGSQNPEHFPFGLKPQTVNLINGGVFVYNLPNLQFQAAQILKSLEHYIKTEQKDRMHTINSLQTPA